ncbi:hypothetical protein CHARACLAT_022264 [Characodon lateralis]|uniref:Uncharacterized protein n=1 Tax=Characodon lateralis TaxID=208331 RepID=A0ABU7EF49_9TELE|nr:hypothetical protein [Characodon lateralis]
MRTHANIPTPNVKTHKNGRRSLQSDSKLTGQGWREGRDLQQRSPGLGFESALGSVENLNGYGVMSRRF